MPVLSNRPSRDDVIKTLRILSGVVCRVPQKHQSTLFFYSIDIICVCFKLEQFKNMQAYPNWQLHISFLCFSLSWQLFWGDEFAAVLNTSAILPESKDFAMAFEDTVTIAYLESATSFHSQCLKKVQKKLRVSKSQPLCVCTNTWRVPLYLLIPMIADSLMY